MGNRAIIAVNDSATSPAVYLHWNGGPASVLAFLEATKQLGVRDPVFDPIHFLARFTQIVGNYLGGTLSVGIAQASTLREEDNGKYVIGKDFKIVSRGSFGPTTVEELGADDRTRYEALLAMTLKINRPIFERND